MIIREIAEFWIEDCQFKLADFSYSDELPVRKLELNQQLLILVQQSETLNWSPIDLITIESTNIDSVIKEAKAYFLWKSVNCLKIDFRECAFNKLLCKSYPKGISKEQLKSKHILTFGKYKGRDLKDVMQSDPDYVFWMIENTATLRNSIKDFVDNWDGVVPEDL